MHVYQHKFCKLFSFQMVHEHNYFDVASLQLPSQLPSILSLGSSCHQLAALSEAAASLDLINTCIQAAFPMLICTF